MLTAARFGEDALEDPSRTVEITNCARHPGYESVWSNNDMAVCSLAEPISDVPIIPPLMGCEAEVLQPGTGVIQAGYGFSSVEPSQGIGTKRWAPMRIQAYRWTENDIVLEHTGDGTSCGGDSGGPTYVRVADGTWRLAAVLSSGHPQTTVGCELGSVVERVDGLMPWIEEATGVDITPCHDADGTWNPGPDCGGFPAELFGAEDQTWKTGCTSPERSGFSETCGAAYEPEVPGSTGGEETGGEQPAETTGGGDSSSDDSSGSDVETTDMGTTSDGQTSGGGSGAEDESDGCGCRSDGSGPSAGALLFLVAAGLRRRKRSPR